jgi:hypothetical protein
VLFLVGRRGSWQHEQRSRHGGWWQQCSTGQGVPPAWCHCMPQHAFQVGDASSVGVQHWCPWHLLHAAAYLHIDLKPPSCPSITVRACSAKRTLDASDT